MIFAFKISDLSKFDEKLLQKVKEKSFNDFCEEYLPKRTSWGKPIPIEKIMSWEKVKIKKDIHLEKEKKNNFYLKFLFKNK